MMRNQLILMACLSFLIIKPLYGAEQPTKQIEDFDFKFGKTPSYYSQKAIDWLRQIENTENITIQDAERGGELRIPIVGNSYILADGWCEETNTIFEFHGDYWHGNPDIYNFPSIH